MQLGNIKQIKVTSRQALNDGVFNNMGGWFSEWAEASPNDDVYLYFIGETRIGFVYGESANFETLVDFVASYEEEQKIQEEAKKWEAEEFDFGYEAAALGMQRIAAYPKAWHEGYDSFHADETRSENARFV